MKRVKIYVDEVSNNIRQKIEKDLKKVLATYPNSILADMEDKDVESLEKKGFRCEKLETAQKIKLRTVEFDTVKELPGTPEDLKLTPAEISKKRKNYWIVQFVGPVKQEWGHQIKMLGGKIRDYVPENALIVRMGTKTKKSVEKLPYVNWIGFYEPVYKISPLLMGKRQRATSSELGGLKLVTDEYKPAPEGNLNVMIQDPVDLKNVVNEIEKIGGTIVTKDKDRIRISLDVPETAKLAKMTEVLWIEPWSKPTLSNDIAAPIIGVQPVWDDHGLDGSGQIIAVADTGIDTGVNDNTLHQDFRGRIVNIHDRSGDGADDVNSGHGTHVAGSVLGSGDSSSGTIRGMAPNASLVFQAIEQNATENLNGIPANLNDLFTQAYNDGARIHTNSWGNHLHGQYTVESNDIDEFMWDHKDMIILYCAMNDGRDSDADGVVNNDSVSAQGCSKNCITVGACENNRPAGVGFNGTYNGFNNFTAVPPNVPFPSNPIRNDHVSNNPDGMAAFSSRGPTDDGRIKPDVVAPGTNILSARSSAAAGNGWGLLPAGDPNRAFYMFMGGTSMATPLTAGTVTLIRQYLQNVCLHNSSGALLKAMLIHGATPIAGQYVPAEVGNAPDNNQGWGRVNLNNSLFPPYPNKVEFRDDINDTLGTGEQKDFEFNVVNTNVPFRATLVWTDFPSTPAAGGVLVNNLRLTVIAPDNTSTPGAPNNNNVQRVEIQNPQNGTYKVRVEGVNVATQNTTGEKQDFAVVVSAGLEFVDVYIKDNVNDNGIPPSTGLMWQSPDIWVSLINDPTDTPSPNPEYGQTNYVFVKVHNRGPKVANNAEVKLYWAKAGTNLSRPHWKTEDIRVSGTLTNVQNINVPANNGANEGEAIAAFEWNPPDPDDYQVEPGHFCLFATVSHPDDPLLMEDVHLVRWEDNLAWKNVNVIDMLANTESGVEFYVAGQQGVSSKTDLYIERSSLPPDGKVRLRIPTRFLKNSGIINLDKVWESGGGRVCIMEVTSPSNAYLNDVNLKPNENTMVRLEVELPEDIEEGKVYPVFVEQRINGVCTGRVTFVARAVGTPAYIANRRTGEVHYPDCMWVEKMAKRNKRPYNDIDLAIKRGYNGCRFCLPKYDTD